MFRGFQVLNADGFVKTTGLQGPAGTPASVGSDALTVTRSVPPASLQNLTTLGTIDWYAVNGATAVARTQQTGIHAKARGGSLMLGFDWVMNGGTVFSQANSAGTTYTSTLPDDRSTALTAVNTASGIFSVAGAAYGWMLTHLPASKLTRHLVILAESYSCDTELIASLNGQVVTTSTTNYTGTASVGRSDLFTIDYSAPQGGELALSYLLKTALGVNQSPNVKFAFAYIYS